MTRTRLNDITMWYMVIIVAIVPFFLGGNRPLIWIGVTGALSAYAIFYFTAMMVANEQAAGSLRKAWPFAVLFLIFIGYQTVQTLPGLPVSLTMLPDGLPVTSTISVAPHETIFAIARWISFGLTAYFTFQVASNRHRCEKFMRILFWIALLQAVIGFILFYVLKDTSLVGKKWTYIGSLTGTFINRNTVATFLAAGVVLGMAEFVRTKEASRFSKKGDGGRSLFTLTLIVAGVLLLLLDIASTNSRMGLFVTFAGAITYAILEMMVGIRRSQTETTATSQGLRLGLALIIMVAVLGLLAYYGTGTLERLGSAERSYDARASLYAQVWDMIHLRPYTGFGGGAFATAYPLFHQLPVSVDLVWDKAHNTYLGLWSEYGFVFGSIPMLIVAYAFISILFAGGDRRDSSALTAVAVIILSAFHALVDFSLEIEGYTLFFIAIVSAGYARISAGTASSRGR